MEVIFTVLAIFLYMRLFGGTMSDGNNQAMTLNQMMSIGQYQPDEQYQRAKEREQEEEARAGVTNLPEMVAGEAWGRGARGVDERGDASHRVLND